MIAGYQTHFVTALCSSGQSRQKIAPRSAWIRFVLARGEEQHRCLRRRRAAASSTTIPREACFRTAIPGRSWRDRKGGSTEFLSRLSAPASGNGLAEAGRTRQGSPHSLRRAGLRTPGLDRTFPPPPVARAMKREHSTKKIGLGALPFRTPIRPTAGNQGASSCQFPSQHPQQPTPPATA